MITNGMQQGMEEGRRQAYLAALGVPLWTSRHVLPGALPSEPLNSVLFLQDEAVRSVVHAEENWGAENQAEGSQAVEHQSDAIAVTPVTAANSLSMPEKQPPFAMSQRTQVSKDAQQSSAIAAEHSERVQQPAEKSTAAAPQNTNSSFPKFSFFVQEIVPGTAAIVSLGDVPDISGSEYTLLASIMQGAGRTQATGRRDFFKWPTTPNPKIPRDADAARQSLAYFLPQRSPATRWIVFGETVAVYVKAALPQHVVHALPPLSELLKNPLAKRQLWQALNS